MDLLRRTPRHGNGSRADSFLTLHKGNFRTFHHLFCKQSLVFSSLIANGGTEDEVAATRSRGDDGKHEEIFLVGCKKKYIVTKIGYL